MDDSILQAFLAEGWEGLSHVRTELDAVAAAPDDADERLGRITSSLGSIHTGCGFLGLTVLGAVTRRTADRAGSLNAPVSDGDVEELRVGLACIEECLSTLEAIGEETVVVDEDPIATAPDLDVEPEAVESAPDPSFDEPTLDEPTLVIAREPEAEPVAEVEDALEPTADEIVSDEEEFVAPPPAAEPAEVAAIANLLRRAVSVPPALEWSPSEATIEEEPIETVETLEDEVTPNDIEPEPIEEPEPVLIEAPAVVEIESSEEERVVINDEPEPIVLEETTTPGRMDRLVGELSDVRDDLVELALDCEDERFDGPVSRLDRVATELAEAVEGDAEELAAADPVTVTDDFELDAEMGDDAPLEEIEVASTDEGDTMQPVAREDEPVDEIVPDVVGADPVEIDDIEEADVVTYATVAKPTESRTALVVDDSLFYRELVVATLGREGFAVTGVADADAAIALVDDGARFQVVVCHVGSPETLSLAGELREREGFDGRCFATSVPSPTAAERTAAAGWDRWLERFRARDLLTAVSSVSSEAA